MAAFASDTAGRFGGRKRV